MFERKKEMDILRRTESAMVPGENNKWCLISGQKKYRRYDGHVGFESNHT